MGSQPAGVTAGVSAATAVAPKGAGSWLDFLRGLVPANILGLEASTKLADGTARTALSFNVLQIIVVAITIGIAAVRIGDAGTPFLAFNASALALFRRILRWAIRLTPIGTVLRRDSFFDSAPLIHAVLRRPSAWLPWWRSGLGPFLGRRRFLDR